MPVDLVALSDDVRPHFDPTAPPFIVTRVSRRSTGSTTSRHAARAVPRPRLPAWQLLGTTPDWLSRVRTSARTA
jgi:hypothetical protein